MFKNKLFKIYFPAWTQSYVSTGKLLLPSLQMWKWNYINGYSTPVQTKHKQTSPSWDTCVSNFSTNNRNPHTGKHTSGKRRNEKKQLILATMFCQQHQSLAHAHCLYQYQYLEVEPLFFKIESSWIEADISPLTVQNNIF